MNSQRICADAASTPTSGGLRFDLRRVLCEVPVDMAIGRYIRGDTRPSKWRSCISNSARDTTAAALRVLIGVLLFVSCCAGQQVPGDAAQQPQNNSNAIRVNWLYGAYLPRDVEIEPLSRHQRMQLYVKQTYTTWGIYAKTAMFALGDQANNSPREWDGGIGDFGERFASRYGQFAIQNTFSAAGNYALGYEPRYDRCRCSGVWRRTRHALVRNFVTYNSTESEERPQIAFYAGAMAAGAIASIWKPGPVNPWRSGYQSVLTQVAFGGLASVVGEFAPEIARLLKRGKNT